MHAPHIGLLIVDVQRGFIRPQTEHIPAIVEQLQTEYAAIAVSQFENHELSPHQRILNWHRFLPGSDDVDLAFSPAENAFVFKKPHYSCVSYELMRWINANGISEVHVCGIDTEVCVLTSATALFEYLIKPVVLAPACASNGGQRSHQAGLIALERLIGRDNVWGGDEDRRGNGTTD